MLIYKKSSIKKQNVKSYILSSSQKTYKSYFVNAAYLWFTADSVSSNANTSSAIFLLKSKCVVNPTQEALISLRI